MYIIQINISYSSYICTPNKEEFIKLDLELVILLALLIFIFIALDGVL